MNGNRCTTSGGFGLAPPKKAAVGQGQQQKSIIEIYTDWANHYLDKLKGRTKIKDLQTELADGLVLADVIEAVTGTKVPDVTRKGPKGPIKDPAVAEANIQACLRFLGHIGVSAVSDIHARDIREGNLKAILSLFFQLSRFKQQQKQQLQAASASAAAYQSSPMRNCGTPRIPSVPPSPCKSAIPSPNSSKQQLQAAASPGAKKVVGSPARSMLPAPKAGSSTGSKIPNGRVMSSPQKFQQYMPQQGRGQVGGPQQRGLGKRTSSSSGFSSGRSSVSCESSISSSDTNFPSASALRRISENSVTNSGSGGSQTSIPGSVNGHSSQVPSHQSRIPGSAAGRSMIPGSSNPAASRKPASSSRPTSSAHTRMGSPLRSGSPAAAARSPKLARAALASGATEMKDYGLIDGDRPASGLTKQPLEAHYPPHAYKSSGGQGGGGAISKMSRPGSSGSQTSLASTASLGGHQSRIPGSSSQRTSVIPLPSAGSSKIPMSPSKQVASKPAESVPLATGCSVKPVRDEASQRAEEKLEAASAGMFPWFKGAYQNHCFCFLIDSNKQKVF